MKKSQYIRPQMTTQEIASQTIMVNVSKLGADGTLEVDTDTGQLIGTRRGQWGDLWYIDSDGE